MRGLADRRSRGEAKSDLLLETSGLANPSGILNAIGRDPVLVHHIRIVGTVVPVDAKNAFPDSALPYLALHQMRAADHLILTKTDTIPAELSSRLVARLMALSL